jgi:hypothetical protein
VRYRTEHQNIFGSSKGVRTILTLLYKSTGNICESGLA